MSRSTRESHACSPDATLQQRKAQIRQLNDELRRLFAGGHVMITPGVKALASDQFAMVLRRVCRFADFNPDNDPHDERDFGAVEVAGMKLFWKIDYYDLSMEAGSPDPADPEVTARVLTIMLASEY